MKRKLLIVILVLVLCLSVFAACDKNDPQEGLDAAKAYVRALYGTSAKVTGADYERIATWVYQDTNTTYTITWTAAAKDGSATTAVTVGTPANGKVVISVDPESPVDVDYVLTATITDPDGNSTTISFEHTVPMFKVMSFAEYLAAADDDAVVVRGIVTAMLSKTNGNTTNGLYLTEENGGYYVYNLSSDPVTDGIKVGDTVLVRGNKDTYNGTYEIVSATVEVESSGAAVVARDITDLYKAAAAGESGLKDAALNYPQAQLVTIKGVTITGQNVDSGYYYFSLDGLESYVRISSSSCPLSAADVATFKEGHSTHTGWIADVTGIICVYSGNFYLTPATVAAFDYVSLPALSDEEAVAFEKGNLELPTKVGEDTDITLPSAGVSYDVAISWDFKADTTHACATIEGGVLQITLQEAAETITLVATLTKGEVADTVEFVIEVEAMVLQQYIPEYISAAPVAGTYKLALDQAQLGTTLYALAEFSSHYLATTDKAASAADVVVAVSGEGYTLMLGGKYLEIAAVGTYINIQLNDASNGVWKWNSELGLLTWTITGTESKDGDYYIGTRNTYNTLSASLISYISGDNAANVGVSQFPAKLCTLAEADWAFTAISEPTDGVYKMSLTQANLEGAVLYADGSFNSNEYMVLTDVAQRAVDVTLAAVDGGYTLMIDGKYLELYVNNGGSVRPTLVDASTGVWSWLAEAQTFTWTISGTESRDGTYYLGTYSNYSTISASKTSYITGDSAANIGVSQFPVRLGTLSLQKVVLPSAQEVLDKISIPAEAYEDITLPADAVWTVKEGTAIQIVDGVAKVTRGAEDATVVLTATVTIGEDVASKDFTIVVKSTDTAVKGTLDNPYTVAEALAVAGQLASGDVTDKVYVKGLIISVGRYGSYLSNVYIADTADGTQMQVYSVSLGEGIAIAHPNDTVLIHGYIMNYKGTSLQIGTSNNDYSYIVDRTIGTSTISYEANESAAITLDSTSGLNDSTFTFSVVANSGWQIVSVKVNGTVVTAGEDGKYTGTVAGNTVVKVETLEEGAAVPQLAATLSFADKANRTLLDPDTEKKQVWEQNGIVFTNTQGASTSKIADYSNPVRCYKSSDVTVAYTGMVKIVFNCSGTSNLLNGTLSAGEISIDGTVVTITFSEPVDSVTISTLTAQARINSIEVYTLAE